MWVVALIGLALGAQGQPLSATQALDAAVARIPSASARVERSEIWVAGANRDVWSVHLDRPAGGSWIAPIVQIDPASGVILRVDEGAVDAIPVAAVYRSNPVVDPVPIEVGLPLAEHELEDDRMDIRQCRDLGESSYAYDVDDTLYALHICSVVPAMGPRPDTDYLYPPIPWPVDPGRDEDNFVASNLYWNIHRGLDWFEDLGWVPDPDYDARVEVLANLRNTDMLSIETATDPALSLQPYDNAYHQRGYWDWEDNWVAPRLVFGQGSEIDYGYDADVILHELTHLIVSSTSGPSYNAPATYGPRVEAAALNEGLADYFSCAIQGDPHLAEYASGTTKDRDTIRELVGDASCRGDLWGEPHYDSQPFSQGLWAVRQGLSAPDQRLLDQVVLQSLPVMGPTAKFETAVEVISAAADATLGTVVGDGLRAEWHARAVDDCVPIVDVVSSDEPFRRFTQIPAFSPFSEAARVPGYLQFRVEVPTAGSTVRIAASQSEFLGLDLSGTAEPQEVKVIGAFADRIKWTAEPIETTMTFSGYTFQFEVSDWQHDATGLGKLTRVGTRAYEEDPERYLFHDYELVFEPEATGTLVFQFANDVERTVTLSDLTITVTPPAVPATPEPTKACGCASDGASPTGWLGVIALGSLALRRRSPS